MESEQPIPTGFTTSKRSSNLLDLLGPLFESGAGPEYRLGLRVDERHSNSKGFCHGAVLALLADVHLGRLCAMSADPPLGLVTSGLTLNYLSAAKTGDWLEAHGQVDRVGRTLAHSTGVILANGKPVLRGCGTFQVLAPAR
ncbi:MAG: PaaI family thioesterase [Xanthobacteraceae bacterium]